MVALLPFSTLLGALGMNPLSFFVALFEFIEAEVATKAMAKCTGKFDVFKHSLFAIVIIGAFAGILFALAAVLFIQSIRNDPW
ncbi:MAG: hypothetical protein EAX81_03665 [Candidatus Thorarchaeota archaeon]|nr:hypothetical protein [Candidatus Thorarchaeota archaeon]